MLLSGVALGIAAGIAFGGDWRRLSTFTLYLWPLLIVGAGLRLVGEIVPTSPLAVYFFGLLCIAVVAARNYRLPGAALISVGTFSNVVVVLLNAGMPVDMATAREIDALPRQTGLHIELGPGTIFPFLWLQAAPEEVAGRHEMRSTNFALFWLAQRAGQKAVGTITAAIDNDPDTEVKKKAVFALSQFPKDEGVPMLIQVAKTNSNPAVRKQAMFWLAQSKDPRAIDFFAQILK